MAQVAKGVPFEEEPHGEVEICEWMVFQTTHQLREAMRIFNVANGFLIRQSDNDKRRYKGFVE